MNHTLAKQKKNLRHRSQRGVVVDLTKLYVISPSNIEVLLHEQHEQ